ncbi:MAG: type II toxin-antitoxin system VapC family toxin [Luteolibacter sp.]
MKWLLDTNVCIDVLRGRPEVVARFRVHSPEDFVVSVITEFELLNGTGRAPEAFRDSEKRKVNSLLAQFQIIPFDSECAKLAGKVHASLLNDGTPVGIMDVFIAATAMKLEIPVVTSNLRDFSRFQSLVLLDWRENGE